MTNHVSSMIIILQYAFHYLIFDYRCPKHPPFEKYQTSDFPALPPKSRIFRGCSLLWLRPNSNYWSISLLGPELPGLTRMFLTGYTTSKWPFQREQFFVSSVDLRRHPWGFIVSLARTNMAMWWATSELLGRSTLHVGLEDQYSSLLFWFLQLCWEMVCSYIDTYRHIKSLI